MKIKLKIGSLKGPFKMLTYTGTSIIILGSTNTPTFYSPKKESIWHPLKHRNGRAIQTSNLLPPKKRGGNILPFSTRNPWKQRNGAIDNYPTRESIHPNSQQTVRKSSNNTFNKSKQPFSSWCHSPLSLSFLAWNWPNVRFSGITVVVVPTTFLFCFLALAAVGTLVLTTTLLTQTYSVSHALVLCIYYMQ